MLERLLLAVGYGLCHQLPERSFAAGGVQVPVCARDTGIYVGFAVSLGVVAWLSRGRRPSSPPPLAVSLMAAAFLGVMAADGLSASLGWRQTNNDLRLATGLLAGYGLSALTVPLLSSQIWSAPGRDRVLGRPAQALAWLATLPVVFAALRWGGPWAGAGYAILVVAAVLVTFCAVNLVIACLLPPFENRASRFREAWAPLLVAVLLTSAELYASALLKAGLDRVASRF